jgi:hypothetical protein
MLAVDWIRLVIDVVPATAIILGALYTLYEYRRFRRYSPKIQFNIDFKLYPVDNKSEIYLVDIEMSVKNVGQVRMYLPEMFVNVKTVGKNDLNISLETHERFKFTEELIENANMAPTDDPWWVEPGVTQIFPVPLVIKKPNSFVQVNAKLNYYDDIDKYRQTKSRKEREKIRIAFHQASIVKPIKECI